MFTFFLSKLKLSRKNVTIILFLNLFELELIYFHLQLSLFIDWTINQTISIAKYPLASDGRVRDHAKYLVYATHWGLIMFTLAFCFDTILVLLRYIVQGRMKTGSPHYEENHWGLKVSMFLTAVSYPWILSVTIVYYAALFTWTWSGTWDSYLDLHVHLFITVIALLDTCVSSRPWSLWHVW